MKFTLEPEVADLGIVCACVVIDGIENRSSSDDFDQYRQDLFEQLNTHYTPDRVETDPILDGFRTLHDRTGRSNRKFPSSSERLLELFLKRGSIPSISVVVDIYNCLSLDSFLSIGAHDVSAIEGDIALRMTDGQERFWPLGKDTQEAVPAGEYAYVDSSDELLCWMEVRQAEKTKVRLDSTSCVYMIQGNPNTSLEFIEEITDRLVDLTQIHCGGRERILWMG